VRSGRKRVVWQKISPVSGMATMVTVLVSLILVIFQFAGILHLRMDELLCLILALLIIICGTLLSERYGMLQEIKEKLERLTNQKND
jgi:hypothetical protein